MSYEIHIRPNQRWWHLPAAELWAYRDLFLLLVRRDFIAKYKQTLLGPAWFFLQPLFTTIVFTIIFGKVARIPTDGIPPFLFYLCGLLPWNFFTQTFIRLSVVCGQQKPPVQDGGDIPRRCVAELCFCVKIRADFSA
ncbi:MAG: hypothetical protein AAF492_22930, partial [Verrucomicrobiota bacterium]